MTSTRKLSNLVKRVARQELQLNALRKKLGARLGKLNRRREELRLELQAIEAQIAVAAPSKVPEPSVPAVPPVNSKLSLAKLLVQVVSEGNGKPVAMAELKERTMSRGVATTSSNLSKMIEARAYGLVQRGLLRRDSATGGFCLPASANGRKTATRRPGASSRRGVKRGATSLRAILVDVFKKNGRTLSVSELVEEVRKTGYRSKSKDFKNLLWVSLGKIPELERAPEGGYRLKKGKA